MRLKALALAFLVAFPVAARADLPFLEDDFAKASARAKAKGVPIFVEAWAPW